METEGTAENMLISYTMLRRLIGSLGVLLPVILLLGCCFYCDSCRYPSISAYYNTEMRDIFVGTICSIAVFLFCYRGYESKDHMASMWAGISALGVALFGTDMEGESLSLTGSIHYVCAVSFFCALAYFCLFLFTKTKSDQPATAMKLIRNKIYRICGYAMIVCLILIFIYQIWLISIIPGLASFNPVFWLESFALWAFGISWVVKGEMIFADTPS